MTIYEIAKSDSRLTHIFNKEGVEKSYLITTIKESDTRKIFIEAIEDETLTVKQTKQAISFIQSEDKSPEEAIKKAKEQKSMPAKSSNKEIKFISISEYNSLKSEYEKLLKEKKELESKLQKNSSFEPKIISQKTDENKVQKPLDLSYLN